MNPSFEFQATERTLPFKNHDDLANSFEAGFTERHDFRLPSITLGETEIHAKEVRGE